MEGKFFYDIPGKRKNKEEQGKKNKEKNKKEWIYDL